MVMDDREFTEAIRGCQEKEKQFFENLLYQQAWQVCHIYANNPYKKRGVVVKIEDLINVKGQKEKQVSDAEKLAKMDEVFEKWDRAKEKLRNKKG